MPSMRVAVFLLALVCAAVAFQCYSGVMTSNKNPGDKTECPKQFCTKVVISTGGSTTYNYGCDLTGMCTLKQDECHDGVNGARICCCGSNLCNSSTKLSALFAVVPLALMKLLAF